MKFDLSKMSGEIVEFTESWYSWPQNVEVPAGSYYKTWTMNEFEYTRRGETVELQCAGDWVNIVSNDKKEYTCYIMR